MVNRGVDYGLASRLLLQSHGLGCRAPRLHEPVAPRARRDNGRPGRGTKEKQAISNKVFVGNLSFDVSREELIEAFSAAGKVVDAKVPTDRETGRPRGFAFVEFEDDEAAQKSISLMNGKDLKGRPLRVNEAENRPPRPAGGGAPFRPSGAPFGAGRPFAPSLPPDGGFDEFGRGDRPFKAKGSRRNIRRRKRGFD